MPLRFNITGIKLRQAAIVGWVEAAHPAALRRCGLLVEREAKRLLNTGGGKDGVPSAPGAPPHLQSGVLRASVAHAMSTPSQCIVGPTERYGAAHEFGSKVHPKRPFMRPALHRTMRRFPREFEGML